MSSRQAITGFFESAEGSGIGALQEIKGYLQIRSSIEGVVTDRDLHAGALVGPSGAGDDEPIVKIQQNKTTFMVPDSAIVTTTEETFCSGFATVM